MLSIRTKMLAAALLVSASSPAFSQAVSLKSLDSSNAKERMEAFFRIRDRVRVDDAVAQAVIRLAEREQAIVNSAATKSLSEEFGEYYAELIQTVTEMKDPRAVSFLVGAIETGNMAQDGLVALGETALPAVVGAIRSTRIVTRFSAARVLGEMATVADSLKLSDQSRATIRLSLLSALSDSSHLVRIRALDGLESFSDAEVVAAVRQMASSDPYVTRRDGVSRYRVREAATKWIQNKGLKH